MAKKNKKKSTPLSSIMRAFCIAGHFPAKTPSEFRAELPIFKQRYQELLSDLHYTPPAPSVTRTADNYEFLESQQTGSKEFKATIVGGTEYRGHEQVADNFAKCQIEIDKYFKP